MQLTHAFAAVLCLALGSLIAVQDGKKPAQAEEKKLSSSQREAQRIREGLIGAWQLSRASTGGEEFSGAQCGGLMLITDEFMSLTARFQSPAPVARTGTGEFFAAGGYRWRYDDERLLLVTTTLLGMDNFAASESWSYLPGGERREYKVDLAGDVVTLTREGGRRFDFTRVSKPQKRASDAGKDEKKQ